MLFFSLIYLSGQTNKGDFLNLFAVEPALNKVMYTNQQLHVWNIVIIVGWHSGTDWEIPGLTLDKEYRMNLF